MTITKSAMTISSVAMALLFGGGVYLMMNMNIIAKNYIEREASRTLGVSVTLGQIDIDVKARSARAKNLVVANPDGFEKPYAVKVETINVILGDVTKSLAVLQDVEVVGVDVNLEVRKNVTNLAAISNRIPETVNQPDEALKVIVDKLTVSQATITPSTVLFTKEAVAPVAVSDFVFKDVGRKENGIPVSEAMGKVWSHVAYQLNIQALQSGLLEGMSPEALQEMGLGFAKRFKDNLEDAVKDKVQKINDGIDQIFND
ncbi:MAG: hypothetical protein WBK77_03560 [Alphaproteobacteria bacterium]